MRHLGWKVLRPDNEYIECGLKKKGACYGYSIKGNRLSKTCVWSPHLNYCMEILKPEITTGRVTAHLAEHACNRKRLGRCYGAVALGKTKDPMICAWLPKTKALKT